MVCISKGDAVKAYMESKHGKEVARLSSKKTASKKGTTKKATEKTKKKKELSDEERKEKQLEIIKKTNPMNPALGEHTWINSTKDIKNAKEAFKTKIDDDEDYLYPDFTKKDGEKALASGKITVYSSKEIKNGNFVSPSKMMAQDYAGSGKVFSKTVNIDDVAWIDSNEGQFCLIDE